VAERAGVPPITVSRTLSGSHPVAEETRRRVLAAARELGYTPDLLARGLAQRRVDGAGHLPVIGMVVLDLGNPFFAAVIEGVQREASARGQMVIVSQSGRDVATERACLQQLRQLRVAGVLITPAPGTDEHLRALRREGLEVVCIARPWAGGPSVTVDEHTGGGLAGAHLSHLGHQELGLVTLDEPANLALAERIVGYQDVVRIAGARLRPESIIHTRALSVEAGSEAASRYARLEVRPTGVFITADSLAIGFVHRLRSLGLRVPEDVAVVGYDDILYAEYLPVPLSTVRLPKHEMGRRAACVLLDRGTRRAQQPLPDESLRLPPSLVVRASCGASRA
jgi:LacI family transcriptional regulator